MLKNQTFISRMFLYQGERKTPAIHLRGPFIMIGKPEAGSHFKAFFFIRLKVSEDKPR